MEHVFYIIYRIEEDIGDMKAGYYKYVYDLANQISSPCEYSADRNEWTQCEKFNTLAAFQEFFLKLNPAPMRMEREDYVETIYHKGKAVPVFLDDYGQCFYCIYDNEVLSFGSFQTEYEDEVKSLIEFDLAGNGK